MIKLLEEAIAEVKELPESEQEIAARFLFDFAHNHTHAGRYQLTDAQLAEVEAAKREKKFATDEEMEQLWKDFGL